jgi:hypothetical protein
MQCSRGLHGGVKTHNFAFPDHMSTVPYVRMKDPVLKQEFLGRTNRLLSFNATQAS